MKFTFLTIAVIFLISCNSKSTEMAQGTEIPKIENEELTLDSSLTEIKTDTVLTAIDTEEPDDGDAVVTVLEFEKTPCFGRCPVFAVQMLSDGRAFYYGKMNVEKMGHFEVLIDGAFFDTILQEAEKIGYFNFAEKYPGDGAQIPDLPKTITFLNSGKQELRVIDSFSSPLKLQQFEDFLNEMIDNLAWKKVEAED